MKYIAILILTALGIFIIDQNIKFLFVNGYRYHGECISLVLSYNKGVAFSMFAFLADYLKYIQIALLLGLMIYAYLNKEFVKKYIILFGMFLGAGAGNIYDRFIHEGVVDYVYWHCGFNFAIFNFADVIIDISFVLFLILYYINDRKKEKQT